MNTPDFSELLRKYAARSKMSLRGLADKLGVSAGAPGHWARRRNYPEDASVCISIASVLELSHEEYVELNEALQAAKTTEYMQEQVARLTAKSEALKSVVTSLAQTMAARKIIPEEVVARLTACLEDLDEAPGRRRLAELLPELQLKPGKPR